MRQNKGVVFQNNKRGFLDIYRIIYMYQKMGGFKVEKGN